MKHHLHFCNINERNALITLITEIGLVIKIGHTNDLNLFGGVILNKYVPLHVLGQHQIRLGYIYEW